MKIDLKKTAGAITAIGVIVAALFAIINWVGGKYLSPAEYQQIEMREVAHDTAEVVREEQDDYHEMEQLQFDSIEAVKDVGRRARTEIMEDVQVEQRAMREDFGDIKLIMLTDRCLADQAQLLARMRVGEISLLRFCTDSLGIARQVGDTPPTER